MIRQVKKYDNVYDVIMDSDICKELSDTPMHIDGKGYPGISIDGTVFKLHHFIVGVPDNGYIVDHQNGNRLDARRENLRHITQNANMQNRIGKGVYTRKYKCNKPYYSKITHQGKRIWLGNYATYDKARQAYINALYELRIDTGIMSPERLEEQPTASLSTHIPRPYNYAGGVYYHKIGMQHKPYQARMIYRGRNLHLGYFATWDEAHQAYLTAKNTLSRV